MHFNTDHLADLTAAEVAQIAGWDITDPPIAPRHPIGGLPLPCAALGCEAVRRRGHPGLVRLEGQLQLDGDDHLPGRYVHAVGVPRAGEPYAIVGSTSACLVLEQRAAAHAGPSDRRQLRSADGGRIHRVPSGRLLIDRTPH